MKTTSLSSVVDKAIKKNNIHIEADKHDLQWLQKESPYICIANQSLEYIDELVLMQLLNGQDTPFKIIGPQKKFESALEQVILSIAFNPIKWEDYVKQVYKFLKSAREQKVIVCLVLHFTDKAIDTAIRNNLLNQLMKVILKVELPIVPVRIKAPFPKFVRPRIGKMMLLKKRKEPYKVTVRIGKAISVKDQQKFKKSSEFRRYLQSKIYSLGTGLEIGSIFKNQFFKKTETLRPLADPVDPDIILEEINKISAASLIAQKGDFDILIVKASQIPYSLREIGRLRELTFRQADEGTGKPIDLDEFDLYYRQLILWDRKEKLIVGGYRMGLGDEILERYGAKGLYISSLFKVRKGFHPIMQAAVELGRSYIIPTYQKKRLPLFLLWKGILYFLLKNPQYQYLYGPVSISKFYSNMSRGLIVSFIKNYYFNHQLAQYLKPKKPFKAKIDKVDIELLVSAMGDQLRNLDHLIEDIEPAHIKIPVLVRQYLKLNARFISFNVDPNFSNVLDGFIVLNLKDVPASMIDALKKEI